MLSFDTPLDAALYVAIHELENGSIVDATFAEIRKESRPVKEAFFNTRTHKALSVEQSEIRASMLMAGLQPCKRDRRDAARLRQRINARQGS